MDFKKKTTRIPIVCKLIITAALFFLPFLSTAYAQDNCADILRDGAFDITNMTSDERLATGFVNYMAQSSMSRSEELKSGSHDVGGEYFKVVKGRIEGKSKQEVINELRNALQEHQSGNKKHTNMIASFARHASKVITNAWTRCMDRYGFYVSMKLTYDPNVFWMVFQYRPDKTGEVAILEKLIMKPSSLHCEYIQGKRIGVAQYPVSCTRNSQLPATIGIEADRAIIPGSTYSIPAIKPLPVVEIVPELVQTITIAEKSGARWSGKKRKIWVTDKDAIKLLMKECDHKPDCSVTVPKPNHPHIDRIPSATLYIGWHCRYWDYEKWDISRESLGSDNEEFPAPSDETTVTIACPVSDSKGKPPIYK